MPTARLRAARGFVETLVGVARTGALAPVRPDRLLAMLAGARRWGPSYAAIVTMAAARHPHRPAVIDGRGELDWATLDARTHAIAHGLRRRGVGEDSTVGILCRNHRGFVEALAAAGKVGADVVLLNTGFAGPQLAEVARREGITALVHDLSFEDVVVDAGLHRALPRVVAWTGGSAAAGPAGVATFDLWVEAGPEDLPPRPGSVSEVTILSSGTTGAPKGARRSVAKETSASGLGSQLGIVARVPLRAGSPTLVSAPLFHTWGLSGLLVAGALTAPVVLHERFRPDATLAAIDEHGVEVLVVVPVMLQRILDLPDEVRRRDDTSSLRVVFTSGSALPAGLALRWMDAFGDNLYNLYGSTEVAAVAVARPSDLRASPDTAGPVLPGVEARLLDDEGRPVPVGSVGRIFVRSGMLFEGYTGGGTKPTIDGFMSTGDVGRVDTAGRLHVEGREDDMIVSGGENVVPQEVEDVLLRHPAVADAAVVGVPDDEFGQRLVAYVVLVGDDVDPDALRAHVRDNLANYKVPREVVLIDRLPRNPTGKLLRRRLTDATSDAPLED